jgi:hypothetical protein
MVPYDFPLLGRWVWPLDPKQALAIQSGTKIIIHLAVIPAIVIPPVKLWLHSHA